MVTSITLITLPITLFFSHSIIGIKKFLQTVIFSAYLVYYYKFNLNVRAAQVSLQYNRHLVKIAIAMGASVGLAYFIFTISVILGDSHIAFVNGAIEIVVRPNLTNCPVYYGLGYNRFFTILTHLHKMKKYVL